MSYRGTGTTSSVASTGGGIVGLAVLAVGIWAIVCAARVVFAAVGLLVVPADLFGIPGLARNIVENIVLGIFAGLLIGLVAAWRGRDGEIQNETLSELFEGYLKHANFDAAFWGEAFVFASIGAIAAVILGAIGALAMPPYWSTAASTILTNPNVPLAAFAGGGFGGPGGSGFLALLFLALVVLLLVIASALLVSLIMHLLLYGIGGMTKGTVQSYVARLVKRRVRKAGKDEEKSEPLTLAMRRGLLVGILVGILEAGFSAWGVAAIVPGQ